MPLLLKCFVACYVGGFGINNYLRTEPSDNLYIEVTRWVFVSAMAAIFSYGVICLIMDIKKGGIRRVIRRLKRFKNGEF